MICPNPLHPTFSVLFWILPLTNSPHGGRVVHLLYKNFKRFCGSLWPCDLAVDGKIKVGAIESQCIYILRIEGTG